MHPRPEAAPSPQLCSLDQTRGHGIPLNITQQGNQVVVILYRACAYYNDSPGFEIGKMIQARF
jgi:hypothetical protein